ncbi:7-cyano-7-deazaguanine synthase [Polymorphospora sp. NPDC050346]|uniref:7-cyano-7-deazaguanine synthase n=1 Tax=Polymorphospora sp. NPDC050346 TaxID=3155780 RepID=UPI0033E480A0
MKTLNWLTDDEWDVEFASRDREDGPLYDGQHALFETIPQNATPALFSGGLDSCCGLAIDSAQENVAPISIYTNSRMRRAQNDVLAALKASSSHSIDPLTYRIQLAGGRKYGKRESSQRTRGFLFLSVGIATSWAIDSNVLRVYENGVGALNIPYLKSQFGSQATRSMHPLTLLQMSEIASKVASGGFTIQAPYLGTTKGDLIGMVPQSADPALAASISCDSGFSARSSYECGSCTSCLLRRQSLQSAGRGYLDDSSRYRRQTKSKDPGLSAMLWQVSLLEQCLAQAHPWRALVSQFPSLLKASHILDPNDLVRLYDRYVQEWRVAGDALGVDVTTWQRRGMT